MRIGMQFAAIACAGVATAAAAQPNPARESIGSELVSYADLNLSSSKDRARLDWRVRSAASRLCTEDDRASPAPYVNSACFRSAMAGAHDQMDRAIARAGASPAIALASPQR